MRHTKCQLFENHKKAIFGYKEKNMKVFFGGFLRLLFACCFIRIFFLRPYGWSVENYLVRLNLSYNGACDDTWMGAVKHCSS